MASRADTAFEWGWLCGYYWAGNPHVPMHEVTAVYRGERRVSNLRDYVRPEMMATIHRFGHDRAQTELDAWEGFVAGVNELVEGSLDSAELLQKLEEDAH